MATEWLSWGWGKLCSATTTTTGLISRTASGAKSLAVGAFDKTKTVYNEATTAYQAVKEAPQTLKELQTTIIGAPAEGAQTFSERLKARLGAMCREGMNSEQLLQAERDFHRILDTLHTVVDKRLCERLAETFNSSIIESLGQALRNNDPMTRAILSMSSGASPSMPFDFAQFRTRWINGEIFNDFRRSEEARTLAQFTRQDANVRDDFLTTYRGVGGERERLSTLFENYDHSNDREALKQGIATLLEELRTRLSSLPEESPEKRVFSLLANALSPTSPDLIALNTLLNSLEKSGVQSAQAHLNDLLERLLTRTLDDLAQSYILLLDTYAVHMKESALKGPLKDVQQRWTEANYEQMQREVSPLIVTGEGNPLRQIQHCFANQSPVFRELASEARDALGKQELLFSSVEPASRTSALKKAGEVIDAAKKKIAHDPDSTLAKMISAFSHAASEQGAQMIGELSQTLTKTPHPYLMGAYKSVLKLLRRLEDPQQREGRIQAAIPLAAEKMGELLTHWNSAIKIEAKELHGALSGLSHNLSAIQTNPALLQTHRADLTGQTRATVELLKHYIHLQSGLISQTIDTAMSTATRAITEQMNPLLERLPKTANDFQNSLLGAPKKGARSFADHLKTRFKEMCPEGSNQREQEIKFGNLLKGLAVVAEERLSSEIFIQCNAELGAGRPSDEFYRDHKDAITAELKRLDEAAAQAFNHEFSRTGGPQDALNTLFTTFDGSANTPADRAQLKEGVRELVGRVRGDFLRDFTGSDPSRERLSRLLAPLLAEESLPLKEILLRLEAIEKTDILACRDALTNFILELPLRMQEPLQGAYDLLLQGYLDTINENPSLPLEDSRQTHLERISLYGDFAERVLDLIAQPLFTSGTSTRSAFNKADALIDRVLAEISHDPHSTLARTVESLSQTLSTQGSQMMSEWSHTLNKTAHPYLLQTQRSASTLMTQLKKSPVQEAPLQEAMRSALREFTQLRDHWNTVIQVEGRDLRAATETIIRNLTLTLGDFSQFNLLSAELIRQTEQASALLNYYAQMQSGPIAQTIDTTLSTATTAFRDQVLDPLMQSLPETIKKTQKALNKLLKKTIKTALSTATEAVKKQVIEPLTEQIPQTLKEYQISIFGDPKEAVVSFAGRLKELFRRMCQSVPTELEFREVLEGLSLLAEGSRYPGLFDTFDTAFKLYLAQRRDSADPASLTDLKDKMQSGALFEEFRAASSAQIMDELVQQDAAAVQRFRALFSQGGGVQERLHALYESFGRSENTEADRRALQEGINAVLNELRGSFLQAFRAENLPQERLALLIAPAFSEDSPYLLEIKTQLKSLNRETLLSSENALATLVNALPERKQSHLKTAYNLLLQAYADAIAHHCKNESRSFREILNLWKTPAETTAAVNRFLGEDHLAASRRRFTEQASTYHAFAGRLSTELGQGDPLFSQIPVSGGPEAIFRRAEAIIDKTRREVSVDPRSTIAKTTEALSEMATQKIDAMVSGFGQTLNRSPHPFLLRTQTAVNELINALGGSGEVQPVLESTRDALAHLHAHWDAALHGEKGDLKSEVVALHGSIIHLLADPTRIAENKAALRSRAEQTKEVIDFHVTGQKGIISQTIQSASSAATETLMAAAAPVIDTVQPAIDTVRSWLGIGSASTDAPVSEESSLPLITLIRFASHYLTSRQANASFPKKLISVGALLLNVMKKTHTLVNNLSQSGNAAFTPIAEELTASLATLNSAIVEQNVENFETALSGCLKAIESIKVYGNTTLLPASLNFLTLPLKELMEEINGPSSVEEPEEIDLNTNIQEIDGALENTPLIPEQIAPENINQQIFEQKDTFVNNTTSIVMLKVVFENICGLPSAGINLYLELIRDGHEKRVSLWTLVEQKLIEEKVGWFKRKIARAAFLFSRKIVKPILQDAATNAINLLLEWMEENKETHFASLRNSLIHNANSYLSILIGVYRRIGIRQDYQGELPHMIGKELEKEKYNGGYESNDLYSLFADAVLNKVKGNWFLGKLIKKAIGSKGDFVENLVKGGADTLVDQNGYSHAFNCVILQQLEDLWKEITSSTGSTSEQDAAILKDVSDSVKTEIRSLVKNMIEFLHISPNTTPGELNAMARGTSPMDWIHRTTDSLFIDDVIKAASDQIAITFHTLFNEDKLKQLFLRFTSLVNETYTRGKLIEQSEFKETERKLKEKSEQILNFIVHKSVDESLQFTKEKEQTEVNKIIQSLKEDLEKEDEFWHTTQRNLQELASMDLMSPLATQKIKTITANSKGFLHKWRQKCLEIKSSQMSSENKQMLQELIDKEMSAALRNFNQKLAQIINCTHDLETSFTVLPAVNEFQSALTSIRAVANAEIRPEAMWRVIETAIPKMEEQLNFLARFNTTEANARDLRTRTNAIGAALANLRNLDNTREFLKANGALEILGNDLLRACSSHLTHDRKRELETSIQNQVRNIAPPLLGAELQTKLLAILNEGNRTRREILYREYVTRLRGAHPVVADESARVKQQILSLATTAAQVTSGLREVRISGQEEKRAALAALVGEARAALAPIEQWKNEKLQPVAFINLSILPNKNIKKHATGLVFSRIKDKLHGILTFIRDPLHYRYGFLHHLVMIPTVGQNQKSGGLFSRLFSK